MKDIAQILIFILSLIMFLKFTLFTKDIYQALFWGVLLLEMQINIRTSVLFDKK